MDAYDLEKIQSFKRLGLKMECIEAYDSTFLVVIEGGQLRKYNIKFVYDVQKDKQKVKLESCETFPSAFSKPVFKMKAIPKCSLLIAAYDNMLNVHDLDTYELKSQLLTTKGVTQFDVIAKERVTNNRKFQARVTAQLCAAVGKKLKLFLLNGDVFEEQATDMVLVTAPRALLWCKKNLFVGLNKEYFVMRPETDQIHDVFAYDGQQKEPLMTRIDGETVLLGHGSQSIFVNRVGKPDKIKPVVWSGIPLFLIYEPPYLIAVLNRYVEVKSANPSVSIQQMDVKNVECVTQGSGVIFMKTTNNIYVLTMKPLKDRLKHILHHKQFGLAIQAVTHSDLPTGEKTQELHKLETYNGVHLFCLQKFEESMKVFMNLDTDPSHVVGMFPDLLPTNLKNSFEYSEKLPQLQGLQLDKALTALIDYLKQKRENIDKLEEAVEFSPILNVDKKGKNETLKSKDQALNVIDTSLLKCYLQGKNETLKIKDQALNVIDTSLLKCYLQVNDALIAPLLRTPGNKVHTKVAEKVLKEGQKFAELIILYEQQEMHKEALDMIKEQSSKSKSSLYGTDMAVHYLTKLGVDHLQLIFDHAKWVIDIEPRDALKIFTDEHQKAVIELPRGHVLSFILNTCPDIVISYLEHVIYVWDDTTEEFHDELAEHLRVKVTNLHERQEQNKARNVKRADSDSGMFGKYRVKLMTFLTKSKIYKPERVLTKFPFDAFFEERAVLLGRMNHHEQALGIYIYILKELAEVDEYCFRKFKEGEKDVYLSLLKVYLSPPDSNNLGLTSYTMEPQSNMQAALDVLEAHGKYLDLQKVLDLLPEDLSMKKLATFLDCSVQSKISMKKMYQVRKKLQIAEFQLVDENMMKLNKMIMLDDDTACFECHRKVGESLFAHKPEGTIVHYGCIGKTTAISDDFT